MARPDRPHDLAPAARVTYFMTGPDGETYHGWWRVVTVDAPRTLKVEDGFADADGTIDETMPVTNMLAVSPNRRSTNASATRSRPPTEAGAG